MNKKSDEIKFIDPLKNDYELPTTQEVVKKEPEKKQNKTEKGNYQIALDDATKETLMRRHGLVQASSKAVFNWPKSIHKKLGNISTDTEISMEDFMRKWCEDGLKRFEENPEKEIKEIAEFRKINNLIK